MKRYWLLIAPVLMAMCLWCVAMVRCDYPINMKGRTMVIDKERTDRVYVLDGRYSQRVTLTRYYEDNIDWVYVEKIPSSCDKIIIYRSRR